MMGVPAVLITSIIGGGVITLATNFVRDPTDSPVPVQEVQGQRFVGCNRSTFGLCQLLRGLGVLEKDMLNVDRVGEQNGGPLAFWNVESSTRVPVLA